MGIALGTVQFGLDYGINNAAGKVQAGEVKKILDFARQYGVQYIDTASSYGDSEEVLGRYFQGNDKGYKVISKLNPIDVYQPDVVQKNVDASLKRLSLDSLYGYLVHRFKDFMNAPQIMDDLNEAKKSSKVQKVGFSLYSPMELDELLAKDVNFDMVQFPYSVFDRRFEPYFERLKAKDVEIHVRSVFLQGLAFMDGRTLPTFLKSAEAQLNKLEETARKNGLSHQDICLNFGLMNFNVDQVVFGVDSLDQLKNNLASLDKMSGVMKIKEQLKEIEIKDEKILLPYLWSKK